MRTRTAAKRALSLPFVPVRQLTVCHLAPASMAQARLRAAGEAHTGRVFGRHRENIRDMPPTRATPPGNGPEQTHVGPGRCRLWAERAVSPRPHVSYGRRRNSKYDRAGTSDTKTQLPRAPISKSLCVRTCFSYRASASTSQPQHCALRKRVVSKNQECPSYHDFLRSSGEFRHQVRRSKT